MCKLAELKELTKPLIVLNQRSLMLLLKAQKWLEMLLKENSTKLWKTKKEKKLKTTPKLKQSLTLHTMLDHIKLMN